MQTHIQNKFNIYKGVEVTTIAKTGNLQVLKYGIIIEGNMLANWQLDVLNNLQNSGLAELRLIIIPPKKNLQEDSTFTRVKNKLFSKELLYSIWQRLITKPQSATPVDPSYIFDGVNLKECNVLRKGRYRDIFSDKDVNEIKNENLDFILRFGLGILTGDILGASKFGVWSFHHGDERLYRGRPACFWEMYDGQYTIGGILQRLTNKLDSGVILKRWSIRANPTGWSDNLNKLQMSGTYLPVQVCKDILYGESSYLSDCPSMTTAPVKFVPTNWEMLRFLIYLLFSYIKGQINRFFIEDWLVGVSKGELENITVKGIKNPRWLFSKVKGVFLADPFAIVKKNGLDVYVEKFDLQKNLGEIVKYSFNEEDGFSDESLALTLDSHLSYPFLIEYNGMKYCIPESKDASNVCIYQISESDGRLVNPLLLLDNVQLSDATVFQYKNKWWMFALEGDASLVCYYAHSLFGPWIVHNNNPLKIDPSSSRPAGPVFMENGTLIRPSQDCSKEYGWRVCFNQIDVLSENSFQEKNCGYLEADKSWDFNHGIHSISQVNGYLIFDAKKKKFDAKENLKRLYKKLRLGIKS